MSRSHKYKAYPEFTNLEKIVWNALNTIGKTIPQIENERNQTIKTNLDHGETKKMAIWHTKSEIDRYVENTMNLRLKDYGTKMSENPLYKAIANEIGVLRRKGILVDWRHIESRNTGMGVWRLNRTKLTNHVNKKAILEMRMRNYRAEDSECTIFVRQKQSAFRKVLLENYVKCALCMFKIKEYLIGAHIVPYSVMRVEDPNNAMNPTNGLLLCKFCDVAFEHGSIKVSKNYEIDIVDSLRDNETNMIKTWLASIPSELCAKNIINDPPDPKYLEWKSRLLESDNCVNKNIAQ